MGVHKGDFGDEEERRSCRGGVPMNLEMHRPWPEDRLTFFGTHTSVTWT
jgi:hypothetical protein